jgi:hypothetical protein
MCKLLALVGVSIFVYGIKKYREDEMIGRENWVFLEEMCTNSNFVHSEVIS